MMVDVEKGLGSNKNFNKPILPPSVHPLILGPAIPTTSSPTLNNSAIGAIIPPPPPSAGLDQPSDWATPGSCGGVEIVDDDTLANEIINSLNLTGPQKQEIQRISSRLARKIEARAAAGQAEITPTVLVQTNSAAGTNVGPNSPTHSSRSGASSRLSMIDICRICHCEGTGDHPLITPCYCSGTLRWVHQKCLQQWIKSSQTRSCEVCRYSFIMESKLKPFRKWEKLDMSGVERRKILCSVTFHIIAITCVVWSLYVLIERTAEEIRLGNLDWPFWTKLVVVAIGFTGGLVFMYVQCKMYVQLFKRWRAYNKVIYVQNCPENPNNHSLGGTFGRRQSGDPFVEMNVLSGGGNGIVKNSQ